MREIVADVGEGRACAVMHVPKCARPEGRGVTATRPGAGTHLSVTFQGARSVQVLLLLFRGNDPKRGLEHGVFAALRQPLGEHCTRKRGRTLVFLSDARGWG